MSTKNIEEIVPGLYKITLPIPIRTLRSVFVYLVRDGDENLLIDTGWGSEESYKSLTGAFNEIGFSSSEIRNIVISHLHPDHFGLTSWIKKDSPKSRVLMHRLDADNLSQGGDFSEKFLGGLNDWLMMQGTPKQALGEMVESFSFENVASVNEPDVKLTGGEMLKVGSKFTFEVIHTPGHTIGQICLFDHGGSALLFSGDHVLPMITPNVSLSPLYNGDPLGDYLNSLQLLKKINASKVLPSHEYIFEDLPKRLEEIESHHVDRLQNTLDTVNSVRAATSGYEVASKLRWFKGSFDKLTAWEKRAAVMETLAHLEYLRRKGKIVEVREGEGAETRILYVPLAK